MTMARSGGGIARPCRATDKPLSYYILSLFLLNRKGFASYEAIASLSRATLRGWVKSLCGFGRRLMARGS